MLKNVDIQYEIIDVCTKCKLTIFLKKKKKKCILTNKTRLWLIFQ